MEANQIVLGYELNHQFAQISYLTPDREQPETYAFREEGERFNVPLLLCKRKEVNQWCYGDEAKRCHDAGDGTLVQEILQKALDGENITITEETEVYEYEARKLLTMFVKKSFGKMGFFLGNYQIKALVITVEKLDKKILEVLELVADSLQLDRERIFFQNYMESIYHYLIFQPKELRSYQVGVFDFGQEKLKSYRVEMNYKTKPVVTLIHPQVHGEIERILQSPEESPVYYEVLDQKLATLLKEFVGDGITSAIYLIGDGFTGDWYKESLNFICRGRKVFGGNNLYSKGAALAARERISSHKESASYVYLGEDKLKYNVGLRMLNGLDEDYVPILDAGVGWFEAKAELDFMLLEGSEIPFIITPMMGSGEKIIEVGVEGFELRKRGTVRLHMSVWMESEKTLILRIRDDGFGDFFPPEEEIWEKVIELGEET